MRHGRLCLLALLTCGAAFYYWRTPRLPQHTGASSEEAPASAYFSMPALSEAVARDLTLNASTCASEFPAFYPQLASNVEHWRKRGGFTSSSMNETLDSNLPGFNSRILIIDGQLYLRSYRPDFATRTRGILRVLDMALQGNPSSVDGMMPDVDLVFSPGDTISVDPPGWVLSRPYKDGPGRWLMPDFSFASWPELGIPSYAELRREAALVEAQYTWSRKGDRAFFRGTPHQWPVRVDLLERAKAAGAERWADVERTDFWVEGAAPLVKLHDHCKHKYLVMAEGHGYSGRAKYLFNCKSVVIRHKLEWREHWHAALNSDPTSPHQNNIEVAGPLFQGIEETMLSLQANDSATSQQNTTSKAECIASSAHRILASRYLTPAATACYIRAALRSYASVQVGEPPRLIPGAGVAPGAGLKENTRWQDKVEGDVSLDTWLQLGQPAWPPRSEHRN